MSEATTKDAKASDHQMGALLFIHAQTGLHPGSGTALGTVDLPVQRERHTQWPIIPGSTLKGILRDACRRRGGNNPDLFAAFGPETAEADKHAGALSLTDARILAFPVRSLKGVFAWVTCRAVLERLQRDLTLIQANGPTQERLKKHLVILHDDDFTHFARHATEIVARVGLDYERKTVKSGALFYEEFLPAETLFYSVVLASPSRREGYERSASQILRYLRDNMPPVLQIGGDETIGKGLCAVRLDING